MALSWKKIAAPLVLAFAALGLAGCDSPADTAAKPQLIHQMVENSVSICAPAAQGGQAAYASRLTAALDAASATDIRTLANNHVTPCLDQRLNAQTTGFWDTRAQGVLFENVDGTGAVATIWDNGRQPEDAGFFHDSAASHSGYIIHAFAAQLRDGDVKAGQRWYAYDTTTTDGNGGVYVSSSAKPEATFDKDTLAKNPFLKESPVTAAPAAPAVKGPGASPGS